MSAKTEEQIQEDSILEMLGEEAAEVDEEEVITDPPADEETEETTDAEETPVDEEAAPTDEGGELETEVPAAEEEETPGGKEEAVVETPVAEIPADELSQAQARIASLMQLIESQSVAQLGIVKPEVPTPGVETETPTAPQTLADIVGDVDFNAMQDDPTKFIDMLSRVVEFTKDQTRNEVQSNLGNVVSQQTTQVVNMQQMVSDFYRDNSELSSVKQTVSVVAKNVGVEHPDWELSKVLETAAEQTRTMLGIKPKPATEKKRLVRKGKKPAIPKQQRGKRSVVKKTTKEQQQINDLID